MEPKIPRHTLEVTQALTPGHLNGKRPSVWDRIRRYGLKVLLAAALAAGMVMAYSAGKAGARQELYDKGFGDGAVLLGANIAKARENIATQERQISRLQGDLAQAKGRAIEVERELQKSRTEAESLTRQRDRLAQSLKEARESYSGRASALREAYQKKIRGLMKRPQQKKIEELEGQLDDARMQLQRSQEEIGRLTNSLKQSQSAAAGLKQQMAAAKEELESVLIENRKLSDRLKEAEKFVPVWLNEGP